MIQPAAAGTITNSATVTTGSADPNSDDDTASVVTTVLAPTADLALGLVDSPDPVLTGYNPLEKLRAMGPDLICQDLGELQLLLAGPEVVCG